MSFHHGLSLSGTPLWLDARRRRDLCILTSLVRRPPPRHRRLVVSSGLARGLRTLGFDGPVLPTPYGRWLGVGGQRVQLLDAGVRPGAAVVVVEQPRQRLLFCGYLRRCQWQPRLTAECGLAVPFPAGLPAADYLVAEGSALGHRGKPIEAVTDALGARIEAAAAERRRVTIVVESVEVGLELVDRLAAGGHGVRAVGVLGRLAAGGLSQRLAASASVAVLGHRLRPGSEIIWVDTGLGAWGVFAARAVRSLSGSVHGRIALQWYADTKSLREGVVACGARSVALIGVPRHVRESVRAGLGGDVPLAFLADAEQLRLPASAVSDELPPIARIE